MQDYLTELHDWVLNHKPVLRLEYQVPLLGEGGSCSLFGELDPTPFDLTQHLTSEQLKLVNVAQSVCDWVEKTTDLDWFGIYLMRQTESGLVLTKIAYYGEASRAEFPVTKQFAQISNNSSVALSGHVRVVNNVDEYVATGGEYYTCDPKVKSELCCPIKQHDQRKDSANNKILGIIDAECFKTNCFDAEQIQRFEHVCEFLAEHFLTLTNPTQ